MPVLPPPAPRSAPKGYSPAPYAPAHPAGRKLPAAQPMCLSVLPEKPHQKEHRHSAPVPPAGVPAPSGLPGSPVPLRILPVFSFLFSFLPRRSRRSAHAENRLSPHCHRRKNFPSAPPRWSSRSLRIPPASLPKAPRRSRSPLHRGPRRRGKSLPAGPPPRKPSLPSRDHAPEAFPPCPPPRAAEAPRPGSPPGGSRGALRNHALPFSLPREGAAPQWPRPLRSLQVLPVQEKASPPVPRLLRISMRNLRSEDLPAAQQPLPRFLIPSRQQRQSSPLLFP